MIRNFVKNTVVYICFLTLIFTTDCRIVDNEARPLAAVGTIYDHAGGIGEAFGIAERNGEIFFSDGERGAIYRISDYQNFSLVTDRLDTPSAIAFNAEGDLVVADSGTHTIKKVNVESGAVETIAGVENVKGFADGDAASALFNAPIGIAFFENKIFIADTYNDSIRLIEDGAVSTVAGGERGFVEGVGTEAKFDTPCGIAVTKDGNLIIADTGNRRLRLIEPNGRVSTIAGNGQSDSIDGFPPQTSFVEPTSLAIDSRGVIYVADGNSIRALGRRFFPFVETLTDTARGFADGDLRQARFNRPSGLAIDKNNNIFVADAGNRVVRVLTGADDFNRITDEEIKNLRYTPEEFRSLGEPRWTYDPPEKSRDIAATFGEIRGEIENEDSQAWFHNGLDIAGAYGETARFIRGEKVTQPFAAQNFGTKRELIRMPTLGYIHIRIGRDKDNVPFDDARFQFSFDEKGKVRDLRIPRGAKFTAGEAIGTLNSFNHVHLIAGRSGAEMNALDALVFPNIKDTIAPTIEKVIVGDHDWREYETRSSDKRITISGAARVVVRAFDRMEGNAASRKLGVYRLGYQILSADETPISDEKETIVFDRLPESENVNFVYAPSSQSGYKPLTIFDYIVTNEARGGAAKEDFFDTKIFANGNYILRVFAADFFGNRSSKDTLIAIEN